MRERIAQWIINIMRPHIQDLFSVEVLYFYEPWVKTQPVPQHALEGDAGIDIVTQTTVKIDPGEQRKVRTGLHVQIPKGYVGVIKDRSSMADKRIITHAGVMDSSYTGEYILVIENAGPVETTIEPGVKLAQLLVLPVARVRARRSRRFDKTERGEKGFGSTNEQTT